MGATDIGPAGLLPLKPPGIGRRGLTLGDDRADFLGAGRGRHAQLMMSAHLQRGSRQQGNGAQRHCSVGRQEGTHCPIFFIAPASGAHEVRREMIMPSGRAILVMAVLSGAPQRSEPLDAPRRRAAFRTRWIDAGGLLRLEARLDFSWRNPGFCLRRGRQPGADPWPACDGSKHKTRGFFLEKARISAPSIGAIVAVSGCLLALAGLAEGLFGPIGLNHLSLPVGTFGAGDGTARHTHAISGSVEAASAHFALRTAGDISIRPRRCRYPCGQKCDHHGRDRTVFVMAASLERATSVRYDGQCLREMTGGTGFLGLTDMWPFRLVLKPPRIGSRRFRSDFGVVGVKRLPACLRAKQPKSSPPRPLQQQMTAPLSTVVKQFGSPHS